MFADICNNYSDVVIASGEIESEYSVDINPKKLSKADGDGIGRGSDKYVFVLKRRGK